MAVVEFSEDFLVFGGGSSGSLAIERSHRKKLIWVVEVVEKVLKA
jgi:hypothetical protein